MSYLLNIEDIKRSKLTNLMILINIIFYIVVNPDYNTSLFYSLTQESSAVMNGEVWRLFTSMFLHFNIVHLVSNMIGLLIFGNVIENQSTFKEYFIFYFGSGLFASFMSFLLTPRGIYSAGASGVIYGLMGGSFLLLYKQNPRIFIWGLFYITISLIQSLQPGIGFFAHLFGLLAGILIGKYFIYATKKKRQKLTRYTN